MNTGKQLIALFIVIGACLGIAAFVMVLTSKQNCQTKEKLTINTNARGRFVTDYSNVERRHRHGFRSRMASYPLVSDFVKASSRTLEWPGSFVEAPAEEATRQQMLVRQRRIKMSPEVLKEGKDHTIFATTDGKVQKGIEALSA